MTTTPPTPKTDTKTPETTREQEYWESELLENGYQPDDPKIAEKLREAGKRIAERRK